jgi:uncharacterized membrane protein
VVAGLRTLTAPAAVSWAARLGWLHLEHTPLAWLGSAVAPYIFTIAAVAELINDKLPRTPSRKEPGPFIGRVLSGAVCGAAIGWAGQGPWVGIVLGALGGVAGTLGGYELRMRLARAVGRDLPIALLEDAIAVVSALCIVSRA